MGVLKERQIIYAVNRKLQPMSNDRERPIPAKRRRWTRRGVICVPNFNPCWRQRRPSPTIDQRMKADRLSLMLLRKAHRNIGVRSYFKLHFFSQICIKTSRFLRTSNYLKELTVHGKKQLISGTLKPEISSRNPLISSKLGTMEGLVRNFELIDGSKSRTIEGLVRNFELIVGSKSRTIES